MRHVTNISCKVRQVPAGRQNSYSEEPSYEQTLQTYKEN